MARSGGKKNGVKKAANTIAFQALEQRLLLDGAAVATMADAALVDDVQTELELAATQVPGPIDGALAVDHQAHVVEFNGLGVAGNDSSEVVFIDESVPNVGDLLTSISSTAEVYFIDTANDGIKRIAEIMQSHSNVDSLHIVSHGEQGSLNLGSTQLNQQSMQSDYIAELSIIGDALSENGDILIYGCDFAQGAEGAAATQLLADLTGADVAASVDDTGAADKGGDWVLEETVGLVETRSLVAESFSGILAPVALSLPTVEVVESGLDHVFSAANGNEISITDPEGGTDNFLVKISVPENIGTLTLADTSGLVSHTNDGTALITLTGNEAAINAAVDGLILSIPGDCDCRGPVDLDMSAIRMTEIGFINGGFETSPVIGGSPGFIQTNESTIPGWVTSASDNLIEVWEDGFMEVDAHSGGQFVELNARQVSTLSQTFTPAAGASELGVTFAHRGRAGIDTMIATAIDLGADGIVGGGDDVVLFSQQYSTDNVEWSHHFAELGAASGNPILLQFDSVASAGGNSSGNFIDSALIFDISDQTTERTQLSVDNNPPEATDETVIAVVDTPLVIDPLANDSDLDGDILTITSINDVVLTPGIAQTIAVPNGTVTVTTNGIIIVTSEIGFIGDIEVPYTITDGEGAVDFATHKVVVVNDSDGDGVADVDDLDDDNDGILDTVETPSEAFTLSGTAPNVVITGSDTGNTFTSTITETGSPTTSSIDVNSTAVVPGWSLTAVSDGDNISSITQTFSTPVNGIVVNNPNATNRNSDIVIWTVSWTGGVPGAAGTVVDNNPQDGSSGNIYDPSSTGSLPVFSSGPVTNGYQFVLDDNGELYEAVTPNRDGTLPVRSLDFAITLPDGITSVTLTGVIETGTNSSVYSIALENIQIDFSNATITDTDGDGVVDAFDLDSDNDGISDLQESGNQLSIDADTNNDGHISDTEATVAGFTDTNGDGAYDQLGAAPVDTDGDGIEDYLDLDSDNDGIADAVENQPTSGYQTPAIGNDADGDGVVDTFDDPSVMHGGDFGTPEDTDSDGTPDYLDDDSDDDGKLDSAESGLGATTDATYQDTDGSVTTSSADLDNENGDLTEVGFREVNNTPDALDATVAGEFESSTIIDPLNNDTDLDGDALTITAINAVILTPGTIQTIAVPNGTVIVTTDGTITVTPDVGFSGDVVVPYTIEDGDGATDTATHTVEVANAPPGVIDPDLTTGTPSIDSLNADNILVPAVDGTPVSINLGDYLTDPNGDTLTITPGTLPAGATFDPLTSIVTYTPSVDNAGDTVIEFTATDNNGDTITPTVTIQPVNPGPAAIDETVAGAFEAATIINPLGNDTDSDGDALTITAINGVALTLGTAQTISVINGSVAVSTDGTIAVTPDAGFSGDIDVLYTITDADGATDSATHTIEVPNAPPEVGDPSSSPGTPSIDPLDPENILVPAVDGTAVSIDLNDYLIDPNGGALTITPDTLPPGAVFDSVTSIVTFTPTVDNVGETVIPFTVTDDDGGTITPTITIQPVNPGPDATNQTVAGAFETPLVIEPLDNDTDSDGDALAITAVNGITLTPGTEQTITVINGSVAVATDGTITVTPDVGFSGDIDVPYTITDVDGATDTATHTIEIPNAPPVLSDPSPAPGTPSVDPLDPNNILVPAVDGTAVSIDLNDYLTDPNGGALTITPDTLPPGAVFDPVTNIVTFTPTVDNVGETVIPFIVTDGDGGTITPTITIQPVNPGPDATNQTVAGAFETPLVIDPLDNDTDSDGDALVITAVNGVTLTPGTEQTITVINGSVSVAIDGTITVTPDAGFSGDIDVPYTIADVDGATDTATHTVEIPNAPPVLSDPNPAPGTPSVDPSDPNNILVPAVDGTAVSIDLNDYLIDPNGGALTITPDTLPPGAVFDPVTSIVTFMPTVDNLGETVIPFTVTDNDGGTITPTITIQPVNPGPDATNQTVAGVFETPLVIDPLGNDTDSDGDALTITAINGVTLTPGAEQTITVTNGSAAVATDGTITVTPDAGFSGDIDVPYTITDVDGATDSATHTIEIPNAPPVLSDPNPAPSTPSVDPLDPNNILVPAVDGTAVSIDLNDYLIDPNGGALTITPDTLPLGAVFDSVTSIVTFTPTVDNVGDTVILFTVTDSDGGTITPTITIQPVNPGPDATNQTVAGAFETPLVIEPLGNDTDSDGDALAITAINSITLTPGTEQTITVINGSVAVATDGTITVTPDAGFSGDIDVPYTISDVDSATDSATHTIEIPNAPPVLSDPNPAQGTPSVDPSDPNNILVPAVDGTAVSIDLNDYLIDPNGGALTITPDTLPQGAVFDSVSGIVTFTPTVDNVGETVIPFTVTDGDGGTITPTITIQPVNPGPDATNQTVAGAFETSLVIDPLDNDSDSDGDALAITAINGVTLTPGTEQTISVTNGSVAVATDGTITVTPDAGFSGDIDVPYTITDVDGATDSATHTVEIPNAPPVLSDPNPAPGTPSIDPLDPNNILVPAVDGTAVSIDLNDYLIDPNGGALTITPDTLPPGAVFDSVTSIVTFTPTVDNVGETVILFTVTDSDGGTITPIITIQPVNPGPDATNQTVAGVFETPLVIDPLDNDTDSDGDALTITAINGVTLTPGTEQTISVTNGSVAVATDGTITVTPDAGFSGDIDVPYTITDVDGATDTATHTVEIPNAPPVLSDPNPAPGTPSVDPSDPNNILVPAVDGTAVSIDLNDYLIDPNGGALTITPDMLPPGAVFNPVANIVTFTPTVDNVGETVIPFTVTDGEGGTITPTITFQPVNPGPNATNQTVAGVFEAPLVIDPLDNDTDSDGDALTITAINGVTLAPGTEQTITVTNGSAAVATDGTITVTPDAGFSGDIDVPYTITDVDGATDTATHTIEIPNAPPVLSDPSSTPGTPSVDPLDPQNILVPAVDGTAVSIDLNDYLTDPNGGALTITPDTLPPGAVFDPVTSIVTFTPSVDNVGETVIPFTVTDNDGGTITPTITIQPVNPGPDATNQTVVGAFETPLVIEPLDNDTDSDGDTLAITAINGITLTPGTEQTILVTNGSIAVTADGTITVAPDAGFSGDIDVPYTITDVDGATDTATHTIEIPNAPPELSDPNPAPGTPSVDPSDPENILVPAVDGTAVSIDLNDYLTDPNGGALTITPDTLPPGAVFDPVTSIITFTPTVDNAGETVIPFTVTDGDGGTITPTITIQPVNPGPNATNQTVAGAFETSLVIDPLDNDTDSDGDALAITAINGITLTLGTEQTINVINGSVAVATDGTITVTPDAGFSGDIDVPYTIADVDGATDTATHTVEIPNAPPVLSDPNPAPGTPSIDPLDPNNILVPAVDGTAVSIDLNDYLIDPNGGALTITPDTLPQGAVFDSVSGIVTFTPTVDNVGETVIPFTVTDGDGGTITPTITIQPVNPGPDATNQTVAGAFETSLVIDPLDNDSDSDGDDLTITAINGITLTPGTEQTITVINGSVSVAIDGTITVTPDAGFSGDIDVPYTITDVDGATDSATHTVDIPNAPPVVVDTDQAVGTPSIDPSNAVNILVPAVDGTTVSINLDDYLDDPNADSLTIIPGTLPAGATFDQVTRMVTFTPSVENIGETIIPFTVIDNNGGTITPTITIQPVNPGPDAIEQTVAGEFETPIVIDPLANDFDRDGDALVIASINGATLTPGVAQTISVQSGSLTVAADGTITVIPVAGFSGNIIVPYSIQDSDGGTDTATHTVALSNAPPAVIDPDPTLGTPSIDPLDADNILVPAVDGMPVSIDLDDYLNDPNSDTLTITPGPLPLGVVFDPVSHVVTFTPAVDNAGETIIPFTVTDSNGGTITPTLTIQPVNPGPDASDMTVAGVFETPLVINPLDNDADADGDAFTITAINGIELTPSVAQTITVTNGSVTVAIDGTITATPDPGFSGDIDVPYTITDVDGATDTATHTIKIPNAPPEVGDPDPAPGSPSIDPLNPQNILVSAVDGTIVLIDLDDYISDPNGGTLTITPDTLPPGVMFDPLANIVTFTPTVDNVGETIIPFTVTDSDGGTITSGLTIQPVNPAPNASDTTVAGAFETPLVIDPLDNDTDSDGDALTITAINGVALIPGTAQTISVPNGSVAVATDGTITVTPDAGFSGDIDVPYTITDVDGATDSATHTIEIPNAPPEVGDPSSTPGTPSIDPLDPENILVPAVDGTAVSIDLNDYLTDPNGGALTITPDTLPPGTVFDSVTSIVTFTPTVDNVGETVIPFTVTDSDGGTIMPTITIQPVNPRPDAANQTVAGVFETPLVIDPLNNDTDSDGDALTIIAINGVTLTPGAEQTITVTNGSAAVATDGTITVTPDAGFSGEIDVPYTITDVDGATDTATHTIEIPNAPPVVGDPNPAPGTPSVDPLDPQNILVPAVDGTIVFIDLDDYLSDPNGGTLTITPDTLPPGVVFDQATNIVTFTPDADNVGETVIPFTVTDSDGGTITPSFTIQPVNPRPDAIDLTVTGVFEAPLVITPLDNDVDPDGDALTITAINGVALTPGAAQTVSVTSGIVAVAADGTITVTPDVGFSGNIDVPYTTTDVDGASDSATHTIVIPNAPPEVVSPDLVPGSPSIDPLDPQNILVPAVDGTAVSIDLNDYLVDPNGGTLTITPDTLPTGTVFDPITNIVTFTPAVDNVGETVIPFTVTDSDGGAITPTITIQPVNPGPVATNQTVAGVFEMPLVIDPLDNDTDSDGDALTITAINGVALAPGTAQTISVLNGSVRVATDGTITVIPDAGFSGEIDVLYTIADVDGATDTATHTIEIPNAPPQVVSPDSVLVSGRPFIDPLDPQNVLVPAVDGATVSVDLNDYLIDPNGGGLTIAPITLPPGAVFDPVTNIVSFTPNADNVGDTIILLTVTDSSGGTITPTFTIQPVNPGPDAINMTVAGEFETPLVIDPLANDFDLDGDQLAIITINGVTLTPGVAQTIAVPNGTLSVAIDGTITVVPDTGFSGNIAIPYGIEDIDGATDSATHTVALSNAPPAVVDPNPVPGTPSINPLDPENILVPAIDGVPVSIDLNSYLSDPNSDVLTITPGTLPLGVVYDPVSNIITFTPSVDNIGDTAIPFTVTDNNGATITPTITIQPVNPGPDAINETIAGEFETPLVVSPLDNDTDLDGDVLTITAINGVALTPGVAQTIAVTNGSVTVATDGAITVTSDAGFSGDIDVPYTIADEDGATDTATLTVEVANAVPETINPDPTPGTPSIDPLNAANILVPAVDGTPVSIDLNDYLVDPNGDTITITPGTLPVGATFDPVTNIVTFTPAVNNAGDTVISFTATDSNGGTIRPTITIQPVNPAPVAVADTVAAGFEAPAVIDLLANDTDADGDALSVSEINGVVLTPGVAQSIVVPNGTVTVAVDGIITVTPDSGFSGDIDVPYTIADEDGATDTATLIVEVANATPEAINPDPTPGTPSIDPLNAANILVPAVDGTPVSIDLNDYLVDPNGDTITITPGTLPVGATFDPVTNIVTFTPAVNNAGDTVISFTATDSNGGTITPTITIQPVNPAPVAAAETIAVGFETPVEVDPLANDIDVDGDALNITEINGVAVTPGAAQSIAVPDGTVVVATDGTITVTPDTGFSGDIDVPYTIADEDGATDTATLTIEVANATPETINPDPTPGTPSIDPLNAANILVPAVDGTPVSIDLNDYLVDPNGDTITITPGTLPVGATFDPVTNIVTFIPAVDNAGDTVISFTATDSNGGTITPTITIQPANPAPVAVADTVAAGFEASAVIDLLANDTDADGDALGVSEINGVVLTPGVAQSIVVPNGTVTVAVDGIITITPDIGFSGDIDVPYTIADEDGATDTATLTVEVANATPETINPDPTPGTPSIDPLNAANILVPAVDGVPVSIDLNDYLVDPNGDTITITPGTLPVGATFDPVSNIVTFTPAVNNAGDTVISFTATDSNGGTITPTITIQPANPAPVAVADTVAAGFEAPAVIDPLANDTDADGDALSVSEINGVQLTPGVAQSIAVPNGTVEVAADGAIIVTPDNGFSGTIDVPYTIADVDGATDTATFAVDVANAAPETVNPDPTPGTPSIDPLNATNILVPAVDGAPVSIDLNNYLVDPNGDTITITTGTLPAGATFDPVRNIVTFTPAGNNAGETVISFTATDSNGGTISPTITIQPVNPAPVAAAETIAAGFETPVVVDPLANDIDVDGDALNITEINGVAVTPGAAQSIAVPNGTVVVATDGTITVTPDSGFSGDIDVPYSIADEDGAADTATFTVEVENAAPETINPDPTPGTPSIDPLNAENIIVPAVDGTPVTIDLSTYVVDPNGDTLTITVDTLPAGATFDPLSNELTFVPAPDNTGDITVPITVTDSAGSVITPTITIQPVNPAPIANPDTVQTLHGEAVVVDLLGNDTDPDGDLITVAGIPTLLDPSAGLLALNGEDWVFTPADGFSGDAVISYILQDMDGETATSVHTVTVAAPEPVARPALAPITPTVLPEPKIPAIDSSEYQREFYKPKFEVDHAVLNMAESLHTLNSTKLADASDTNLLAADSDYLVSVTKISYGDSEGYSSGKGYRGTHSIDPTDECGRIFVDTIVRDGMLSVKAHSTIHMTRSDGVIAFSATLANGQPLPDWISKVTDAEYLIDRSVDLETVALRLTAHRESGTELVRFIEIDTLTGQIREQQQATTFGSSFYEALDQVASNDETKTNRSLGNAELQVSVEVKIPALTTQK